MFFGVRDPWYSSNIKVGGRALESRISWVRAGIRARVGHSSRHALDHGHLVDRLESGSVGSPGRLAAITAVVERLHVGRPTRKTQWVQSAVGRVLLRREESIAGKTAVGEVVARKTGIRG